VTSRGLTPSRSLSDYFFFADVFRDVDFFAEAFFVPVDLRAVDFVLFFEADFFALLFFAVVFFALLFFAVVFLALLFFAVVFFAVVFLDDVFFAGTLPPAARASDRPIAIACLRLVTFLPLPPLLSVPALRSCITFSTFSCAFAPYFAMRVSSLSLQRKLCKQRARALAPCTRELLP
jgi:hypothetical protein